MAYSQENCGGKTEGALLSPFSGGCTLDRATPGSGLEADMETVTGAGRPTRKYGDDGGLLGDGIEPK